MRKVYKSIIGVIAFLDILLVLTLGVIILAIISIPRILPIKFIKKFITKVSNEIGNLIVKTLKVSLKVIHRPNWDIKIPDGLSPNHWYIAMSNHMSWADIFVLLFLGHKKIPLLKFFMKKELKWIPIIYLVNKTIDMPFVNRHNREQIQNNPDLKKIDFENARIAAKKFTRYPSTAFSFAEGTRFTPSKHAKQHSPYNDLLKPKIGALTTALSGMPMVNYLLDFTIVYKTKKRSAWDFLCGEMQIAKVVVKKYRIPESLKDWAIKNEDRYKEEFKIFIDKVWVKKQALIDELRF
tara:strand:- start:13542 stop:14423 length:882 start_codon:yes stop_codon:yes gene_type:complete